MSDISLTTGLIVSPQMVSQELDDELVVLDLASETYFGLDEVGARTMHLIASKGKLSDVLHVLQDEYAAEPTRLSADLLAFAARLRDKGLVTVVTEP